MISELVSEPILPKIVFTAAVDIAVAHFYEWTILDM